MAITATLVEQGHNRLRYLLVCDTTGTTTLNITTTGAATPDLKTDSLQGPIKQCALAQAQGLGKIAAGGFTTQAQARAVWCSELSDAVLGVKAPRALGRNTKRLTPATVWTYDADISGGQLIVVITANGTGEAYLDFETVGGIGI